MTSDEMSSVLRYKSVMAVVGRWLKAGFISEGEYAEIDTIMAEKYGISSCSIYHSNCLI